MGALTLCADDIAYDPYVDGEDDAADEDGLIEGFELVQYHVRSSPTDNAMKHAGTYIIQAQKNSSALVNPWNR